MLRILPLAIALATLAGCTPLGTDLARGASVSVSSTHSAAAGESAPAALIDGDPGTRWSSAYSDRQWLVIDLKQAHSLTLLRLRWETAAADGYRVLVSLDGKTWSTAATRTGLGAGPRVDEVALAGHHARWLKIALDRRATVWGFSLWEVEVYALPA